MAGNDQGRQLVVYLFNQLGLMRQGRRAIVGLLVFPFPQAKRDSRATPGIVMTSLGARRKVRPDPCGRPRGRKCDKPREYHILCSRYGPTYMNTQNTTDLFCKAFVMHSTTAIVQELNTCYKTCVSIKFCAKVIFFINDKFIRKLQRNHSL